MIHDTNHTNIILLDLGGVVFQSSGFSNELINWDTINRLNHKYGHELNIGENRFPDFMLAYNEETHQNLIGQDFLEAVFDTLTFNSELVEFLRKDYEIIIVSDNYRENIEYISERYSFREWSIRQIYSFDYQMVKSDPAFFKRLVADLSDFDLTKMLFIDDSPKKLESARKSGIKGLIFRNNQQVFEALKANRSV